MNKRLNNEQGVSLVEVLAVLVIGGLMMAISTSLIVQAMNNQERITIESNLRDEADIIMAQLTKAIFTLKESEIEKVECGIITKTRQQPTSDVKEFTPCITDNTGITEEEANAIAATKTKMSRCLTSNDEITKIEIDGTDGQTYCVPFAQIILKEAGVKIGIEGPTVHTRTDSYTISNKNVMLEPYFTIEQAKEPYSLDGDTIMNAERVSMMITFTLRHAVKNNTITFQNEILTVDDI